MMKEGGAIRRNTISYYGFGIGMVRNGIFEYNQIENNKVGIYLYKNADNNVVKYNCIEYNTILGVEILWDVSQNNWIYYNNLIGNSEYMDSQARDEDGDLRWDDGVSLGNYWSDYIPPPPYDIPPYGEDDYPQESPFGIVCGA